MSPLQTGSPGVNELALVARAVGHVLACLVAVALCAGAANRPLRPVRVVAGGLALALTFPFVVFGALGLGLLAPVVDVVGNVLGTYAVVDVVGNVLGTYAVVAAVPLLAAVAVAQAVTDGDVSDPRHSSLFAGVRAQLSVDDAAGVFVATVALLVGELAVVTVVGWL
ncbi:hypothetical protein [Halobaculum limi]|uniref:hypothetical protein n=1 Tax=Halobaculum limi TaxID=3031916 RepID=UPI002404BEA8|nr:hypothetical protein [Halobaculum sp. YSMS11]